MMVEIVRPHLSPTLPVTPPHHHKIMNLEFSRNIVFASLSLLTLPLPTHRFRLIINGLFYFSSTFFALFYVLISLFYRPTIQAAPFVLFTTLNRRDDLIIPFLHSSVPRLWSCWHRWWIIKLLIYTVSSALPDPSSATLIWSLSLFYSLCVCVCLFSFFLFVEIVGAFYYNHSPSTIHTRHTPSQPYLIVSCKV